jgi:hypothetical protein
LATKEKLRVVVGVVAVVVVGGAVVEVVAVVDMLVEEVARLVVTVELVRPSVVVAASAEHAPRSAKTRRAVFLYVAAADDIAEDETPDGAPDDRVLTHRINRWGAGDAEYRGQGDASDDAHQDGSQEVVG